MVESRTTPLRVLSWFTLAVLGATLALGACDGDDDASQKPSGDTAQDTDQNADTAGDTDAPDDTNPPEDTDSPEDSSDQADTAPDAQDDTSPDPPMFEPRLPSTEELGTRRGLRVARGIIHSHSIHSHDACDSKPRLDDGAFNEPCNQDWRYGVCSTRQDYIFNTDHEELAAFINFQDLLLLREGDTVITDAQQRPVANRMICPDGRTALIMAGGEFGVMPVGMNAHLDAESDVARDQMYTEVTPERVASYKELGAVVLQAHVESRTADDLRPLGLDGFEIYNLHANIAPNIREDWLGLEPFGYADDLTPFIEPGGPISDLAFLGFFTLNRPSMRIFDTLLAEGQHLVGVAGTDSHQNSLPIALADGERADSFRRMMRFFSNHLLVPELTPDAAKDALRMGRAYVAFETLGTPLGFDYRAETAAGDVVAEMGDTIDLADAPTLRVTAPTVLGEESTGPITVTLLRATADGAVPVKNAVAGDLEFTPTEPGAYRVEITITPTHLAPFLTRTDLHTRAFTWILANPIYIR